MRSLSELSDPSSGMGTRVRAAALTHFLEVAQRYHLNADALIRKAGLTPAQISQPAQHLPTAAVVDLLEESAQISGCETFGLQMAEMRTLSDFGPISLLLSHQPSMRVALKSIMDYRHLLNESLTMVIENNGRTTVVREEILIRGRPGSRQATELAVGALLLIFRTLLEPHWHPVSAHFTHPAATDLGVHRRVFRCPVHFDSEFNGITCNTSDLDRQGMRSDPVMATYAQSFVDALPRSADDSLLLDIRKSIYLLLPLGRASIQQISQGLGMTVRTLQRRLEDLDVQFSDLINDVRRELAQRYISTTKHPLNRVSEQLGYSNQSAFTRWFVAEFEITPSKLRSNFQTKKSDRSS